MKKIVKPLKSASLILTRGKKSQTSFFDYQILMMKRKARAPWGSILVFPGGVYDPQHDNYLQQKFGFSSHLEATALRECFEQTGLYFTQKPILQVQKINQLKKIRLQFLMKQFNKQNDDNYKLNSRNFIQKIGRHLLPQKLAIPFIRLVTIPQLPNRYDTTFFLHKIKDYHIINFLKYSEDQKYLHETENIIKCDNEFEKFKWMDPGEILMEFFSKQLSLAPPQYMIINTMMRFHKYRDIQDYLSENYNPNDKFGNISLGPNIVSLIPNQNKPQISASKTFKYAATMIGDAQFPYTRHIQNQACPQLKEQIKLWYQNRNCFEQGKNRFLFNTNKQFFEQDYEVDCQLKRSNLRKMMGYTETRGRLQKQVVL